MFTIKSICATTHDSSYGGYKWKCIVKVEVDAKYWSKLKKSKHLGSLYGVDIGNALYAINNAIPGYNPMVDDRKNAKNGIKSVWLTYHFNDVDKAERLGLQVKRWRSGEVTAAFNDFVNIL